MDKICNNNDLIDIGKIGGLVNTISYHKKFCFSRHNVYYMMNHLDDWTIVDMNIRYQSSNIVFMLAFDTTMIECGSDDK